MQCGDHLSAVTAALLKGSTAGMMVGGARFGGARFVSTSKGVIDLDGISTKLSQKQGRHILGHPNYGGLGYFKSTDDARTVLAAFHNGDTQIMGITRRGYVQVKFDGVTGYNNNPSKNIFNQPTNIFMIKGTASPSVVPMSPNS